MYLVYILHSTIRDRYYIGFTGDELRERLKKHNAIHKGFTAKAADWRIVYTESFDKKSEAMKRELEIKSWKSRIRIARIIADKSNL